MQKSGLIRSASLAATLALAGCSYDAPQAKKELKTPLPAPATQVYTAPIERRGLESETSYSRGSQSYETPGLVSGHELRQTTQDDRKYSLEGIVIGGNIFYADRNIYSETGELSFYFVRQEDAKRTFQDNSKTMLVQADKMYVFEPVLNSEGNPAHVAKFSTSGDYAVKAEMTKHDSTGIGLGIVRETEKDARFKIRTARIGSKEWYVPFAPVNDSQKDRTSFYMIPFENTNLTANPDGSIELTSFEGIWRGREISAKDYNARPELHKAAAEAKLKELQEKAKAKKLEEERKINNPGQLELIDLK